MHYAQTLGRPEFTHGWHNQEESKYVSFYTSLQVLVTLERGSSRACIGTTNLAITLPFTLDVKLPASRADRLFLIALEAQ